MSHPSHRWHFLATFAVAVSGSTVVLAQAAQPPAGETPSAPAEQAQPSEPAAPASQAAAEPTEETSESDSLLPPGEEERFADRSVARIRYRPGRGLEIASEDREFSMTTRVRLQVLTEFENEIGANPPALNVTERRARLSFQGNFFGEDNRYKLELAVSPRDVGINNNFRDHPTRSPLLDFYFEFRQLDNLNVRIGQYKVPGNRSRVISSGDLQMVDRTIVNNEFNLDRDVGLDVRSSDFLGLGFLRYYAGVYAGQGFGSSGFDDFGLMYLGRVEILPLGMFDDYDEVDFERSREARLSIGLGYAFIDNAHNDRGILGSAPDDGGTTDVHVGHADAMFKFAGLTVASEFMIRNGHRNPGDAVDAMGNPIPVEAARDGYGISGQAGYLIPRLPLEVSARVGVVRHLGDGSSLGDNNEVGAGLSWYLARHPVKLQLDYFRLGEDLGEGTDRVRIQFQGSI